MTKTDEELAAESKGKDQDQGSSTEKAYKPLFKVIVSNQADGTLEVGPSAKAFKEGFQEVVHQSLKVIHPTLPGPGVDHRSLRPKPASNPGLEPNPNPDSGASRPNHNTAVPWGLRLHAYLEAELTPQPSS